MKLAIIFDDLIQSGGAEQLLLAAHELYPDAPIYTCLISKSWRKHFEQNNIKYMSSFMQKIPFAVELNKVLAVFGLHVLAYESFNLDQYDVVLSISARFAHGVLTKPGTTHICYMNSPGRMIWEPSNYFDSRFLRFLLAPFLTLLRLWDYSAAQRVDIFIANSKTPQKRIQKYYGRVSTIIYPFADLPVFQSSVTKNGGYYIVVSRLVSWKRIDIVIQACMQHDLKLKIVGAGPDKNRLQQITDNSPLIEFCGRASESQKIELIQNCIALIHPQYEDFGITPVEAMSQGKPVIAYGHGGVLETVIPHITGEFFYEQTAESLAKMLIQFNFKNYLSQNCITQANKFNKAVFVDSMNKLLSSSRSK